MGTDEPGEVEAEPRPSMDPLASVAMPGPRMGAPTPTVEQLYPDVRNKPRRLRRTAKIVVAVAVIGGAAYAGWHAYSSRTTDAAPAALQGYAIDVISLDPAKLRGVSHAPNGLDEVGLGVVAADLGAEITDVQTVEVGGRSILEASARTTGSSISIGVVTEGTTVLAVVVTSPEGSGPVLRAAEESLHFAPPHP